MMGLRHFADLETREQYREEDRGDHENLFDEVNGEEDRHDPKFQLHQFEEDQEWEDESLLVLDPSPSSCQFVRKFIKNKGSKRIKIFNFFFLFYLFLLVYGNYRRICLCSPSERVGPRPRSWALSRNFSRKPCCRSCKRELVS